VVQRPVVAIFQYLDYRALLRDLYADRKAYQRGFSHRSFARRAGLRSSNYLQLVMTGQRNLSAEMATRFADAFSLERDEAGFFCDLVAFNLAKTAAERARSYERLTRFRRYREVHKLDADQGRYYKHWYLPAIRELVSCKAFREDPRWIAAQLTPRITPAAARAALKSLLALGLLERDASGNLRQIDRLLTTGPGPLGHQVVSYHRAMLERASEAIERVPRTEREISSLTLCTSQSMLLELKQRIVAFKAELLQLAEQHGPAERVVQINFQLFPLSRRVEEPDV
jgi:uncharacterized protein (TIGR02147 family)